MLLLLSEGFCFCGEKMSVARYLRYLKPEGVPDSVGTISFCITRFLVASECIKRSVFIRNLRRTVFAFDYREIAG
jgi:hypothetical protein